MEYTPPIGGDPGDPYVDGNPGAGIPGSPVPAAAIEHPQRELESLIIQAGLVPSALDLLQVAAAVRILGGGTTRAVSAAGTILTSDDKGLVLADASGGAFTLTLPAINTIRNGYNVVVKKVDSSANLVTIDGSGLESIDGLASENLVSQFDYLWVRDDNAEWHVHGMRVTYESAPQTLTSAGLLTLAHGFAARPRQVDLLLRSKLVAAGWAVGNDVPVGTNWSADSSGGFPGNSRFAQVYFDDATNIKVRLTNSTVVTVNHKTTGAPTQTTMSDWDLVVRANR